jgi:hypothetical protein
MTDDDRIDAELAALFAAPDAAPDEAFVARIGRAVLAEQRMAAARRALWRRFGAETLGSVAVIGVFYLLWRTIPADIEIGQLTAAPAAAASLALLLWLGVGLKPAPSGG